MDGGEKRSAVEAGKDARKSLKQRREVGQKPTGGMPAAPKKRRKRTGLPGQQGRLIPKVRGNGTESSAGRLGGVGGILGKDYKNRGAKGQKKGVKEKDSLSSKWGARISKAPKKPGLI